MRIRTLTASLLIGAASLTGCALSNTEPASAVTHEESAGFDCLTDGNLTCGAAVADETIRTAAWEEWDRQQGYRVMRVDPSREFRVDFDAFAVGQIARKPGSVILTSNDGVSFRFVVTYL